MLLYMHRIIHPQLFSSYRKAYRKMIKKSLSFLAKWAVIFLIASMLSFILVRFMPVSPVKHWLSSYNLPYTPENIAYITQKMNLDKPLSVQYFSWLWNFIRGDWGYSLKSHLNIRQTFIRKLPYSVSIGIFGILISAPCAFFIGYRASMHQNGFLDHFSAILSVLTQSVPSFIISIVIIYFFSVRLKLVKFFTGNSFWALLTAIVLTALYNIGGLSRVVKKSFREEMGKSYVRFSVSRGFAPEKVLLHHASRPVICRLIATVIANFAGIFGGSTVLEYAFAIPGISYFLGSSMKNSDYTVLQTYILVVVIWMFFVHLVLNLILEILDVRRKSQ